jgi:hypothetical protein
VLLKHVPSLWLFVLGLHGVSLADLLGEKLINLLFGLPFEFSLVLDTEWKG